MSKNILNSIITLDKICFPDDAWAERVWTEKWNSNSSHILSYTENGELIGAVIFLQILDEAEILKIFVLPSCRGKGVAERLILDMEQRLNKNTVQQCFLEVRCDNIPAVKLYQKMEFSEVGRRKKYYRHPTCDALIFSKSLG